MRSKKEYKGIFPVFYGWRGCGGLLVGAAVFSAVLLTSGCAKKGPEVPEAKVEVVEAYGQKLDESATPQQVAFVLLQLLKKDVEAAQAHEHEQQQAVLRQIFRLAAYSTIENRLEAILRPGLGLGEKRDKKLFEIVNFWAPIVGHYIHSFDDDFEMAKPRMKVTYSQSKRFAHVLYPVCHDPAERDPEKRQRATLDVELARELGEGQSYWRVSRVSFRDEAAIAPPARSQPTTTRSAE